MKIIWTAVPPLGDYEFPDLIVRVVANLSPDRDNPAADLVSPFILDWPSAIKNELKDGFDVTLDGIPCVEVIPDFRKAKSSVWIDLLFGPKKEWANSPVPKHEKPVASKVNSLGVAELERNVANIYGATARSHHLMHAASMSRPGALNQYVEALKQSSWSESLQWERSDALGRKNPTAPVLELIASQIGPTPAPTPTMVRNRGRVGSGNVNILLPAVESLIDHLTNAGTKERIAASASVGNDVDPRPFLESAIFHKKMPTRPYDDVPEQAPMDVFQRIAVLRGYNSLLEPLGLVFDVKIKLGPREMWSSVAGGNPRYIKVVPKEAQTGAATHIGLRTAVEVSEKRIRAISRDVSGVSGEPLVKNGFLNLGFIDGATKQKTFSVSTMDSDGAAMKLINMASTIARSSDAELYTTADSDLKIVWANLKARALHSPAMMKDVAGASNLPMAHFFHTAIAFANGIELTDSLISNKTRDANPHINGSIVKWQGAAKRVLSPNRSAAAAKFNAPAMPEFYRKGVAQPLMVAGRVAAIRWTFGATHQEGNLIDNKIPSLRTTGISLIWNNRRDFLEQRQAARQKIAAGDDDRVYLEDLFVGVAPDIAVMHPGTDRYLWMPISARRENFVDAADMPGLDGYGIIRAQAVRTLDGNGTAIENSKLDVKAGESVFCWRGTPLGRPYGNQDDDMPDEQRTRLKEQDERSKTPDYNDRVSPGHWGVFVRLLEPNTEEPDINFINPDKGKSLGHFAVRARVADIAGNLPYHEDTTPDGCCIKMDFKRFEPIAPPVVLLDEPPDNFAITRRSLYRMVVRSGYEEDRRWLIPARNSKHLAKWHGVLDRDSEKRAAGFNSVKLDADGKIWRAEMPTGKNGGTKGGSTWPIRRDPGVAPLGEKRYFPDPYAYGVGWKLEYFIPSSALSDPSSVKESDITGFLPFYGDDDEWPNAQPIAIELSQEDPSIPTCTWYPGRRKLKIALPDGTKARLFLSCGLEKETRLQAMALWDQTGAEGKVSSEDAANGFAPTISPALTLELVSAVKEPREAPAISALSYMPETDDPFNDLPALPEFDRDPKVLQAKMAFRVAADAPSSGKIRYHASFRDYVDGIGANGGPMWRSSKTELSDDPVQDDISGGVTEIESSQKIHNLPDTCFRVIRYSVSAVSRYEAEFSDQSDDESAFEKAGNRGVSVAMRSSASPPAPSFSYLIPTYDWLQEIVQGSPSRFQSQRTGGLRLYFSPVAGRCITNETIGVAVWVGNSDLVAQRKIMRECSSCWGVDPIRPIGSASIACGPSIGDFGGYSVFLENELVDLEGFLDRLAKHQEHDHLSRHIYDKLSDSTRDLFKSEELSYDEARAALAEDLTRIIQQESLFDEKRLKGVNLSDRAKRLLGNPSGLARIALNRVILSDAYPGIFLQSRLFSDDGSFRTFPLTNGARVQVVPYEPRFDANQKLWFCDIELQPPAEYAFVRLAVVRFQPMAIEGAEISDPILLDFAQIAPGRTAMIWRLDGNSANNTICVQVVGAAGTRAPTDIKFNVRILMEDEEQPALGWVQDPDFQTPIPAMSPPAGQVYPFRQSTLWYSEIKWPSRRGPRRLILEEESPVYETDSSVKKGPSPYVEILDI